MRKALKSPLGRWILALLGGLLLASAWATRFGWLLFVAWLPWLYLMEQQAEQRVAGRHPSLRYWLGASGPLMVGCLVWNYASVWWIKGATLGGMIGAVVAMSFCMVVVLISILWMWRNAGRLIALIFFPLSWTAFDYFFHRAEILWPWLTLGNGLRHATWAIQFIEYTGILGVSLWVALSNALLYYSLTRRGRQRLIAFGGLVALIAIPIVLSRVLAARADKLPTLTAREVVLVQPNFNPHTEKFTIPAEVQQEKIQRIAQQAITPKTAAILAPETALVRHIWLSDLETEGQITNLKQFIRNNGRIPWVIGASTLRFYPNQPEATPTARNYGSGSYDAYNTALFATDTTIRPYHKSLLVVGVEMLPYPEYLSFLKRLNIDLGGMVGSLATQDHRDVFVVDSALRIAPMICYESVFGEFCTDYVRQGATLLGVITNDGWWGDTPGYRQHFAYSRLRAIELRRPMVQAANTGISGLVDHRGEVVKTMGWEEEGALRLQVEPTDHMTFYARHGDLLIRVTNYVALGLLLYGVWSTLRKKS